MFSLDFKKISRSLSPRWPKRHLTKELTYDASFIPDFSHIHLSAEQFARLLEDTSLVHCRGLVSRIVDFVFHEEDISRVMADEMSKTVRDFEWSSVSVTNEGEGAFIRIHAIK